MSLTARSDRRHVRTHARSERFVLIELVAPIAPERPGRDRPPVNLAFVLDRSGSMHGDKLRLARRAVDESLDRLRDGDRFGLVVYDDRVDVVAPAQPATAEARRRAMGALDGIDARGSTNLAEGWLRGCELIATGGHDANVRRSLLLTDGLANVGITDPDELVRHAAELRARGVQTSTFGVGDDFDEALLQAMADAGGGHFAFIASPAQIADHVTSEVGEALDVVASEVGIEVTAHDEVRVDSLAPFPAAARGARTTIRLGDLVSGQVLRLVLRFTFPHGELGRELGAIVRVTDRDGVLAGDPVRLGWTYADERTNEEQPRDREVDHAVAELFAARARQEAVARNRAGDYAGARALLAGVAGRVRGYAGSDIALNRVVERLGEDETAFARPMAEEQRKRAFFAASALLRTRDAEGRSRRD
ncbi:MAG TPA: VWA domain-containing protein [Candidatus Limnocylindrales bacterium]